MSAKVSIPELALSGSACAYLKPPGNAMRPFDSFCTFVQHALEPSKGRNTRAFPLVVRKTIGVFRIERYEFGSPVSSGLEPVFCSITSAKRSAQMTEDGLHSAGLMRPPMICCIASRVSMSLGTSFTSDCALNLSICSLSQPRFEALVTIYSSPAPTVAAPPMFVLFVPPLASLPEEVVWPEPFELERLEPEPPEDDEPEPLESVPPVEVAMAVVLRDCFNAQ